MRDVVNNIPFKANRSSLFSSLPSSTHARSLSLSALLTPLHSPSLTRARTYTTTISGTRPPSSLATSPSPQSAAVAAAAATAGAVGGARTRGTRIDICRCSQYIHIFMYICIYVFPRRSRRWAPQVTRNTSNCARPSCVMRTPVENERGWVTRWPGLLGVCRDF